MAMGSGEVSACWRIVVYSPWRPCDLRRTLGQALADAIGKEERCVGSSSSAGAGKADALIFLKKKKKKKGGGAAGAPRY